MSRSSIDWRISQDKRDLEEFTLMGNKHLSANFGTLSFERIEVMPGLVANLSEIDSRKAFRLSSDLQAQGDRICLQLTLQGQCGLDVSDGVTTRYTYGTSVAHAVRGTAASFDFPENSRLKTLNFTFLPDVLDDLVDQNTSNAFRAILKQTGSPNAQTQIRTPVALHRLADTVFHDRLNGSLRKLQVDGMSRILIAQFLSDLTGTEPHDGPEIHLDRKFKSRLHDIKDRILADPVNLPSLDELASSTGINRKQLNAGFKALFGTTVFGYSRDLRLNIARDQILNCDFNIKEIAYQAGYSHVTNFVTAYRRHFGVTPGQDAG